MSDPADEAESDISEASDDIQKDESMERDVSDFAKSARKAHENYAERRKNEASGVERVEEEFNMSLSDRSDDEFRQTAKDLDVLENKEAEDVEAIGEEVSSEEDVEDEIQNMIANVDEAEEDIGEALNDVGTDLSKAREIIEKDPGQIGQGDVKRFKRDVQDLENAAKVEDEAENEIEHIIQDLATLEDEDKQLERFERNMQAQFRQEGGVIEQLGEAAEEMSDEELLEKARSEADKLGKLKKKLSEDERITEEAEERLGQEIEEMREEVLKVEDVEGTLQNRDEQLQRLAEEARQQESSTDPQTRQALDKIAQIASQGTSDLADAISQEGSKLQKEEDQVEQLEERYSNLSASGDGLGAGIGGVGGVIVMIVAAAIAAALLL